MPSIENSKRTRPKAIPTKKVDTDLMLEQSSGINPSEAAQSAKAIQIHSFNTNLNGVIEQVAEDKFKHVGHEWAGAREKFPFDKSLWYVDFYYPYAKGGPLYVDQVSSPAKENELSPKKAAMKNFGHRYLMVKPETTMADALEQIA